MLTIKSNFYNFRNRQGQPYTMEDLSLLYKNLIMPDIVNIKRGDSIGFGWNERTVDKDLYDLISGKVIVFNDLSFQKTLYLLEQGFKLDDIYLAFGCWTKEGNISYGMDSTNVYNTLRTIAINNIKEFEVDSSHIITLREAFHMKEFDIICANFPYKAIGAKLTNKVIKTLNFKEFNNLLPAGDYIRNTEIIDLELWQYIDTIKVATKTTGKKIDAFGNGATVTTHLAKIRKNKVNNMTLDEFERSNYVDPQLDKYFAENSKRIHYAIDLAQARPRWTKTIQETVTVDNSFIIHMRDANHGYIPNDATKKNPATSVRWNLLKEISLDYLHKNYWQNDTQSVYGFITFNSNKERDNFTNFMLVQGWTFMCKVMKAMCADCTVAFGKYLPKVDWTHSWTVEEILSEYNYTQDEIEEVMKDLDNFKGQD